MSFLETRGIHRVLPDSQVPFSLVKPILDRYYMRYTQTVLQERRILPQLRDQVTHGQVLSKAVLYNIEDALQYAVRSVRQTMNSGTNPNLSYMDISLEAAQYAHDVLKAAHAPAGEASDTFIQKLIQKRLHTSNLELPDVVDLYLRLHKHKGRNRRLLVADKSGFMLANVINKEIEFEGIDDGTAGELVQYGIHRAIQWYKTLYILGVNKGLGIRPQSIS